MNRDRVDERMHEVLDGVATPAEREALEHEMNADSELRACFDELRSLFETLGRVPVVQPPVELHREILHALEHDRARPSTPGWMESLAAAFRSRPIPAYAMTLVSLAAAGLLLYAALQRSAQDAHLPVTATMVPVPPATTLAAGDASLRIRPRWLDGVLVIEITGEAPTGARLALRFDEASWTPAATGGSPAPLPLSVRGAVRTEVRLVLRGPSVTPIHVVLQTSKGTKEIRLSLDRQDLQH